MILLQYLDKGEIAIEDIKKLLSDLNIDDLTVELEEKKELHKIII